MINLEVAPIENVTVLIKEGDVKGLKLVDINKVIDL